MPVYLDRLPRSHELPKHTNVICGASLKKFRGSASNCLEIGIINNMPDGALESTERQFVALLDAAADRLFVHLTFYALPEILRSGSGRRHVGHFYSSIDQLWDRRLDGLIVTGTEPRSPNLIDEPYWSSLAAVIEWAEQSTSSTIWSCLAAHAAVLHNDGIGRRRLPDKCFGLFDCASAADHPLMAGVATRVRMPHSRWNDLPEKDLLASGYSVLTRSADAGVDAFVKQRKSLFLFFQGHPEYEANTLWLEYRRDVGRYLRRERDVYPTMPLDYFDLETLSALAPLAQKATHDRREGLLSSFPVGLVPPCDTSPWRTAAASLYRNWLAYLCAVKNRPFKATHARNGSAARKELVLRRSAAGSD